MNRRDFVCALGVSAAALPSSVFAQSGARGFRIAYISGGSEQSRAEFLNAFKNRLRELCSVEGHHLVFIDRYAAGRFEVLPALVRELLDWKPDIIFVSTTPATLAVKAATLTVPVVMVGVADPLGNKLVHNLSRPGGNITGITNIAAELAGKRLEILKELVPMASKVAVMINPDDPNRSLQMKHAEQSAKTLSIKLDPILLIRHDTDLDASFETASRAGVSGALRMIDPVATVLRPRTTALAAQYRIPTIYGFREDVLAGGLVSYGPNLPSQYRLAADYVHRIFAGARPADLPVQQPTNFELIINLKAAKSLGLSVPASLLVRADEVLE